MQDHLSLRISGVTKIINSLFLFCVALLLNKLPRIGTSPKTGTLDVLTVSESWRTPVSINVSPFLTLIIPVSNFLTLKVFCMPQPEISTYLVTEDIAGLNAKVT